eukprot:jgi/Tetstr1/457245/TSEL_004174.t2
MMVAAAVPAPDSARAGRMTPTGAGPTPTPLLYAPPRPRCLTAAAAMPCRLKTASQAGVVQEGEGARLSKRHLLRLAAGMCGVAGLSSPREAQAALVQFPVTELNNTYYLVRAGQGVREAQGVVYTNPVAKTSMDSGLSEDGKRQVVKGSAPALMAALGRDGTPWLWPSINQRSYQTAEILAALFQVGRNRIVPEYSFLDARGLGALEGARLDVADAVVAAGDALDPSWHMTPGTDGTPNESVYDVLVRMRQLLSVTETQYYGETVIIISPDSDCLSILQAATMGADLRQHRQFAQKPGETLRSSCPAILYLAVAPVDRAASMTATRHVNIVVVGDPGVGKTSLILAAATEAFPDNPVPTLPPTALPAELTPDGVPSLVVDTVIPPGGPPSSGDPMPQGGRGAASVEQGQQRVAAAAEKQSLQQVIAPLMLQFKEVEACLECSAKRLQFVEDVFYYALKAVIHPTGPLFDTHTSQLKPACIKALKRIFMLCDIDGDRILNDAELNNFQVHCWKTPLKPSELDGIKKVVSEKMPRGVQGGGLTLAGFLFLHSLFIERGRLETTWTVLRSYGYNDTLRLRDDLLECVNFSVAADQVIELTERGREFLSLCFQKYDSDQDGTLSAAEQEDMFSTAPCSPWEGAEWEHVLVETAHAGGLTRPGFLAKWAYTTMKDPRLTLAHVLYLGYKGDPALLFATSRRRKQERKSEHPGRGILQCYVFGATGSGKTGLLHGLVGLPHSDVESGVHTCAVAVGEVNGHEPRRTLVMQEVTEEMAERLLAGGAGREERAQWLAAADVGLFLFDSSAAESFAYAHELMLQVATASGDSLPCMFAASKDDIGMSQELVERCKECCAELAMPLPIPVSMHAGETSSVYARVAEAATAPARFIPETPSLKAMRQYQQTLRRCLIYAGAGVAGGALCYTLYHRFCKRKDS